MPVKITSRRPRRRFSDQRGLHERRFTAHSNARLHSLDSRRRKRVQRLAGATGGVAASLAGRDQFQNETGQFQFDTWLGWPTPKGSRWHRQRRRSLGAGRFAGQSAGGRLLSRCDSRTPATGTADVGLGVGRVPVHPLQESEAGDGAAGARFRLRCWTPPAPGRGRQAGARSGQHPRRGPDAGTPGRSDAGAGTGIRRLGGTNRWRGIAGAPFPGHSCGRAGQRPSAAPAGFALGRSGPSQGHAGRQGRLFRQRRSGPETVQRHAADEKGHGRRGDPQRKYRPPPRSPPARAATVPPPR